MATRVALCMLLGVSNLVYAQDASTADRDGVARAIQAYRDAWLANDRARVMATLTSDAVIFPSGLAPIAGTEAIAGFWFPATGPATTVTAIEANVDDLQVDGDVAVASGRGSLTFVVTADTGNSSPRTQRHWHVNILRRQPDGQWRIWRRMWGDLR